MSPPLDVAAPDRWLSAGSLLVAAVALPTLPALHVCNRLSARRTLAAVARVGRLPGPRMACDPVRIGRAVNGAARVLRMQATTCLARSQLLWLLLSLCGHRPVIRIGAGTGLGDGTLAHAWVELDGVPVADASNVAALHPPFDRPLLGSIRRGW